MTLRAEAAARTPAVRTDRKPPARVQRRRRGGLRWLRQALIWGGAGLTAAGLVSLGVFAVRSGELAMVGAGLGEIGLQASGIIGLEVQEVMVEGRQRVPRQQIFAALGISRGTPMFGFDASAARQRLEAIAWVETATVERQLPDTVLVRLTERRPLALWQREGRFAVIDAKGKVIIEDGVGAFANLPVVIGEDAPQHADALLSMLAAEPDLMKRVSAAVRVGHRRWNLKMDNGIDVRRPEDDAASAWSRLAEIERQNRVLARDVVAVDMRLPDRLIVRVGAAAAERLRPPAAPGRKN
jgi:cell division protein FtsQ